LIKHNWLAYKQIITMKDFDTVTGRLIFGGGALKNQDVEN
jgi:hypothetical protein